MCDTFCLECVCVYMTVTGQKGALPGDARLCCGEIDLCYRTSYCVISLNMFTATFSREVCKVSRISNSIVLYSRSVVPGN